jgi:hypothetical protein
MQQEEIDDLISYHCKYTEPMQLLESYRAHLFDFEDIFLALRTSDQIANHLRQKL